MASYTINVGSSLQITEKVTAFKGGKLQGAASWTANTAQVSSEVPSDSVNVIPAATGAKPQIDFTFGLREVDATDTTFTASSVVFSTTDVSQVGVGDVVEVIEGGAIKRATVTGTTVPSPNLITNPSFETDLSDWFRSGGPGTSSSFTRAIDWSADGTASAKVTGTTGLGGLHGMIGAIFGSFGSPIVSVTGNQTYTLSFVVNPLLGTLNFRGGVLWFQGTTQVSETDGPLTFLGAQSTYSSQLTAPANADHAVPIVQGGSVVPGLQPINYEFDNVQFVQGLTNGFTIDSWRIAGNPAATPTNGARALISRRGAQYSYTVGLTTHTPDSIYKYATGQELTFTALSNFPQGSYPASYTWAFGDDIKGSGGTATHTYRFANPTTRVVLTVTDNWGTQWVVGKQLFLYPSSTPIPPPPGVTQVSDGVAHPGILVTLQN